MGGLGFMAGIPLPLSGFTLQQWFTSSGISAALIGATATLGLAYTLKFLWAPLFDTAPPAALARFGRRRGWLLLVQPLLALAILALGLSAPARHPWLTAATAGLLAFLSASQDILIDAWRIETFPARLQGAALAAYVWGYRFALLTSGAGTIWLAAKIGWPPAIALLAVLAALAPVITLCAPPPAQFISATRKTLRSAIFDPLGEFLGRPQAWRILGFVVLFHLGKVFADTMAAPFYKGGPGFTQAAVGIANFLPGLAGTLLGAALGGAAVARLGARRAILLLGLAQAASLALYPALLLTGPSILALSAKVALENLAGAAASAAFLSFLSGLCARDHTASQYALLSSLAALSLHTIGGTSGLLAQALGWPEFFALTMVLSLPALAVFLTIRPEVHGRIAEN